ncbi:MAG: AMP-binding protein [Magnetococcus sp. DMHC-1]|nr:AMP-binding protein [Magnetococcales bacterium]
MAQSLVVRVLGRLLRVEKVGWEQIPATGGLLFVCNHPAQRDWLLASLLPRTSLALVLPHDALAAHPWNAFGRFMPGLSRLLRIDGQKPATQDSLIAFLRDGGCAVCFPEDRPRHAGRPGKVQAWPVHVARLAGVPLVPVHLEGPQRSRLLGGSAPGRRWWLPRLSLTAMAPWFPDDSQVEESVSPRERRLADSRQLALRMEQAALAGRVQYRTLWEALLKTGQAFSGQDWAIRDTTGQQLTRRQMVFRSLLLSRLLQQHLPANPSLPVGLLLPTSVGGVVTFLALQFRGWLPAMLNFTAGVEPMLQACRLARIQTIVTSRTFIDKAGLTKTVARLGEVCHILILEDLRQHITPGHMLWAGLATLTPCWMHRRKAAWLRVEHPALLMFTSGSEGVPKGVLLSHLNLLTNCAQVGARLDFDARDTLLNILPLFHAFGLTMGTLAPLLAGVRIHLVPSPLDFEGIPHLVHASRATILAGTDTFLHGYGRAAHPLDFATLRLVFSGAEPLRDRTRALWMDKFGLRILEGYGTTEASPVLAVNAPFACRAGSVGCFMPGLDFRLESLPGLTDGGRLWVRGPNIMLGYLATHQGSAGLVDGWYDTGDVVRVDQAGFVFIIGRVKRFAKIGGEMVSLAMVEALACQVWPDAQHAALAIADAQKGEQILLVTTQANPQRHALLTCARTTGLGEIFLPKKIIPMESMPLLGVGKIDYSALLKSLDEEKNS